VEVPLRDAGHWRDYFKAHPAGVSSEDFTEWRFDFAQAPAWVLVRSRPVIEVSSRS
jgi:hypothetical protein